MNFHAGVSPNGRISAEASTSGIAGHVARRAARPPPLARHRPPHSVPSNARNVEIIFPTARVPAVLFLPAHAYVISAVNDHQSIRPVEECLVRRMDESRLERLGPRSLTSNDSLMNGQEERRLCESHLAFFLPATIRRGTAQGGLSLCGPRRFPSSCLPVYIPILFIRTIRYTLSS